MVDTRYIYPNVNNCYVLHYANSIISVNIASGLVYAYYINGNLAKAMNVGPTWYDISAT